MVYHLQARLYFFLNRSWRNGRKSTALPFITESDILMAVLGRPLRVVVCRNIIVVALLGAPSSVWYITFKQNYIFFLNRSRRKGRKSTALPFITESDTLTAVQARPLRVVVCRNIIVVALLGAPSSVWYITFKQDYIFS